MPTEAAIAGESDIYFISSVIERIERARKIRTHWKEETEAITRTEALLERVRDAIRRSQYREAISQIGGIPSSELGQLEEKQLRELMEIGWSAALGQLDGSKEELEGYDLVVALGDAISNLGIDEPALRERVAKALLNKGFILNVLNRREEAIAVLDEVVRRFGEASEPALRESVASALNGIGFAMIYEAKRLLTGGDERSAIASLSAANERLSAAFERKPEDAFILGNLGYVAFLSGNKDEARSLLTRAIALGGEKLRQAELADADNHPLPQDEEFRELVRSIPLTMRLREDRNSDSLNVLNPG